MEVLENQASNNVTSYKQITDCCLKAGFTKKKLSRSHSPIITHAISFIMLDDAKSFSSSSFISTFLSISFLFLSLCIVCNDDEKKNVEKMRAFVGYYKCIYTNRRGCLLCIKGKCYGGYPLQNKLIYEAVWERKKYRKNI